MTRPRRLLTDPRTIALVSTGVALLALLRSSRRPAPVAATQPPTAVAAAPATSAAAPGPIGQWWAVFVTVALAAVPALLIVEVVPSDTVAGIKAGTVLLLLALGSLLALVATAMTARAHNHAPAHVGLDYAGKLVAVGAAALVFWGSALSAPLLDMLWVGYPPVAIMAFGLILVGLLLYRRARQRP